MSSRESCINRFGRFFLAIMLSPKKIKNGDRNGKGRDQRLCRNLIPFHATEGRFEVRSEHVLREVWHLFSFEPGAFSACAHGAVLLTF
jgi:hypothetical protein